MTFAPESWPFVAPFLIAAAALFAVGRPAWGLAALILGLAVLLFFRNPTRRFGGDSRIVLAAGYGKVLRVEPLEDAEIGPGRYQRIVTFLSVFDVHVQTVPVSGTVITSRFTEGKKVPAYRGDAGEVNQKHLSVIELPTGERIGIRQIAGLVARRVVCHLKAGETVRRGQGMGLIKFGSRVDLIVPASYRVLVTAGQRVVNGETPMAAPADVAVPGARP
jgi:phosphatidylserine decarboxylase